MAKRKMVIEPRICPLVDALNGTGLVRTFGRVIGNHVNSALMWKATLTVSKEYVPGDDNDYVPDHVFTFEIRPFNPHEPAAAKRKHVDQVVKQTVESVREWGQSRQPPLAAAEKTQADVERHKPDDLQL